MSRGRLDTASTVLESLHGISHDEAAVLATEMSVAFEEEKRLHSGVSMLDMFRGHHLRRTLVSVGVQCLQ